MLLTHKVLVQWLPTEDLRLERALTLSQSPHGTNVQQMAITAYSPSFASALACAVQKPDGSFQLQVGFSAPTRYDGGWRADSLPESGLHKWDTEPTEKQLVALALLNTRPTQARLDSAERITAKLRAGADQALATELANEKPHPLWDLEKWDAVAGYAPGFEPAGD